MRNSSCKRQDHFDGLGEHRNREAWEYVPDVKPQSKRCWENPERVFWKRRKGGKQRGLHLSVGGEDGRGVETLQRRANSKYGASRNMEGEEKRRNSFCGKVGYEAMMSRDNRRNV